MTGYGDLPYGSGALGGDEDTSSSGPLYFLLGEGDSDATADATYLAFFSPSGDGTSDAGTTDPHPVKGYLASGDSSSDASARPTLTATGTIHNRAGGRNREGLGSAFWEPPVVVPPSGWNAARRRDAALAYDVPVMVGTQPVYDVQVKYAKGLVDRLIVGGVDVTYFRGIPTPFPGFGLEEPLMYAETTLVFPQIAAPFEQLGVGALSWLRPGKKVYIQRVDPDTGAVVSTDYRGVVVDFDIAGPTVSVTVGGEAMGRLALANRQVPIWTSFQDIGRYVYSAMKEVGLRLTPYLGPETGVRLQRFGGQSLLDYIGECLARSWNRTGNQWTVMPTGTTEGVYAMARKDTTTIHGTVYTDDTRTVANMHRAISEEPNRIFVTGVTPAGQRVRFGVYPGLRQTVPPPYPMNDDSPFGVGTTDLDTDTGDGITVMINRLIVTKYLDQTDRPTGYDQQTAAAIRNLQEDAGRSFQNGIMDPETWEALYDLNVTGYSLRWSHIEPAAQRSRVRRWDRSGTGAIIGRNADFDPTALMVDANVEMGSGFTQDQMRNWAKAELETEDNWVGTIHFGTGAMVLGDHTPGDPITEADVFRARDLRPGMNLSLPLFQGGIVVHVASATVGADGIVEAAVDTRARDAMKVWEIITRNRESRPSPGRVWRDAGKRSSTITKDSIGIWDEVGGLLYDDIPLQGYSWTVFPVVAGQEGTVRSLRLTTDPPAEFVTAVFGDTIYASRLNSMIGNPLTKPGARRWAQQDVQESLDDHNILLYVAGDNENPCGYFPKQKTAEGDEGGDGSFAAAAPLTGVWEDDAGFSYHTAQSPVLWVAVFADRDTTIPARRLMWNQLEAGA